MLSPLSLPAENPVVTLTQRKLSACAIPCPTLWHDILAKNSLWVLELHNGADNRLTPTVVKSILAALQAVEAQWRAQVKAAHKAQSGQKHDEKRFKKDAGGALIIVGRKDQDKFFSNGPFLFRLQVATLFMLPWTGLDFEKDSNNSNFFPG